MNIISTLTLCLAVLVGTMLTAGHSAQARTGLTNHGFKQVKKSTRVHASWYGGKFHGRKMANGKRFNKNNPTLVAHKTLPLGTVIKVTNPETGITARATVTDRGPYVAGRALDVSEGLAKKLDFIDKGHTDLIMVVLSTPKDHPRHRS